MIQSFFNIRGTECGYGTSVIYGIKRKAATLKAKSLACGNLVVLDSKLLEITLTLLTENDSVV